MSRLPLSRLWHSMSLAFAILLLGSVAGGVLAQEPAQPESFSDTEGPPQPGGSVRFLLYEIQTRSTRSPARPRSPIR